MLFIVYTILIVVLSPLIVGYHLWRTVRRGFSVAGFAERFGFFAPGHFTRRVGQKTIWVHAVSVGEVMAVKPLLRQLKSSYPDRYLVLSTVTVTGRTVAAGVTEADRVIYFPFDFPNAVSKVLRLLSPELILIAETELWPNFLRAARRRGVPVVLVNGRISDRSFPRYRFLSGLFGPVLNDLAGICMQTEEDARRIMAIGAPANRVHVTRNLKYDLPVRVITPAERRHLRQRYHLPEAGLVFVAGSTHPGEEELVVTTFLRLLRDYPNLCLVLVPRHPERAVEVGKLLEARGLAHQRRSMLATVEPGVTGTVLLLDTVGELMDIYTLADLVFVGGSFVPVGGHNLLEPASVGVPVLFGPMMHNFREITELIVAAGAGQQVADAVSLEAAVRRLLADDHARRLMGEQGGRLMAEQGGAAARHLEVIACLLGRTDCPLASTHCCP
jgi:3-deoxy-D-manno-octulosonic-acid transferase